MITSKIQKAYFNIPLGQVHYRTMNDRDKPVLVLLHQSPSSSAMYESMMGFLEKDFWVIAPDNPGFGNSFIPESPSVRLYADAIVAGLDSIGVKEFHLFGHHTGAAIAVEIAALLGNRVLNVVLSGPPLLSEEQKSILGKKVAALELREDGSHFEVIWNRIRNKNQAVPIQLIQREALLALQAGDQYVKAYHAVFEHDFVGALRKIVSRTMLLAGERDSLRGCLEPTSEILGGVQTKIIPEADTYICDLYPKVVSEVIQKFIFNTEKGE